MEDAKKTNRVSDYDNLYASLSFDSVSSASRYTNRQVISGLPEQFPTTRTIVFPVWHLTTVPVCEANPTSATKPTHRLNHREFLR